MRMTWRSIAAANKDRKMDDRKMRLGDAGELHLPVLSFPVELFPNN
jgi:hypothetical protein